LLQQQKIKNVDGLGLCQLSENVSVHMFTIVMIGSKIKKLQKKLMKKGLSLWFREKKFGKEFVLERFAIHIEVMCGAIRGGKGFTSRN
jgi:hypothetical protein